MTTAAFIFVCFLFCCVQWQLYLSEKRASVLEDFVFSMNDSRLPELNPDEKLWFWNDEPVTWHELCDRLSGESDYDGPQT